MTRDSDRSFPGADPHDAQQQLAAAKTKTMLQIENPATGEPRLIGWVGPDGERLSDDEARQRLSDEARKRLAYADLLAERITRQLRTLGLLAADESLAWVDTTAGSDVPGGTVTG